MISGKNEVERLTKPQTRCPPLPT